jgi:hypothetical protein
MPILILDIQLIRWLKSGMREINIRLVSSRKKSVNALQKAKKLNGAKNHDQPRRILLRRDYQKVIK